jgi:hypothetical protein
MSTTKTNDQVAWGRVWQVGCYSVLLCLGLGLVSKVWGAPLLTKEVRLTAPSAAGFAHFGASVALSANGKVALIGAPYENCPHIIECGAAYVFVRKDSSLDYSNLRKG